MYMKPGQSIDITLPELDFELPGGLPLQFEVDSRKNPVINIEWRFKLAFGFDETDGGSLSCAFFILCCRRIALSFVFLFIGFFVYTFPREEESEEEESVLFLKGSLLMEKIAIKSKLLYFLELDFPAVDVGFAVISLSIV